MTKGMVKLILQSELQMELAPGEKSEQDYVDAWVFVFERQREFMANIDLFNQFNRVWSLYGVGKFLYISDSRISRETERADINNVMENGYAIESDTTDEEILRWAKIQGKGWFVLSKNQIIP